MPTDQIVSLLIAERDKLNRAIEALGAPIKRRGRPPKNPQAVATAVAVPVPVAPAAPAAPSRKPRSTAERKAQAERMKAYWAKRRKEEKKG